MFLKMKHYFLSFICATLISCSFMFPVSAYEGPVAITDVSKIVYSTTNLNVRTGPSTDYNKVGLLHYGDAVEVTGECDNGWNRILYNGNEAFVCSKYVTDNLSIQQPTSLTNSVPGFCESKGASQSWVDKVNRELAYVPENIKQHFVNSGWHIYITTENIAQTYFNGIYNSVRGATFPGTIVIETRNIAVSTAVCHEFGHYLDYTLGFPSSSAEFSDIYNEEVSTFKSRIPNSSCVSSPAEFFAETFYYICKDPSKCTPQAAEFVRYRMGLL